MLACKNFSLLPLPTPRWLWMNSRPSRAILIAAEVDFARLVMPTYWHQCIGNNVKKITKQKNRTVPPLKLSSKTNALPHRSLKSKCTPFKRHRLKNTLYWTEDRFVWYLQNVLATSPRMWDGGIQIVECDTMPRCGNWVQRIWRWLHHDTAIIHVNISAREKEK